MEGNNNQKAIITVNPQDFLVPLNKILTECSNAVFVGLSNFDNLTELPEFITSEDNFFRHSPNGNEMTFDQRKSIYKNWIISKGFEDLIRAVSAMLIEICRVLRINSKITSLMTWGEVKRLVRNPDYDITKEPFPKLLKTVKGNLSGDLLFEKEINSINRVRRCLVHREGIVTPIDFNEGEASLKLSWVYLKIIYAENGKEEEIISPRMMTNQGEIKAMQDRRMKEFKENEKVEISYQLFNELIMTCFLFGQDVIAKLTFHEKK